MPIGNASNLGLTAIRTQLGLDTATPTKELRSKGTDLYVKDGAAKFGKESARTAHQANAVALVKGGLQREYHLTPQAADAVMVNVFGAVRTQIKAGEVERLHTRATEAARFTQGATTSEQAFDIAHRADALFTSGQGGGLPQVRARGEAAAQIVGANADVARAWTLSGLVQGAGGGGAALTQGKTAAALMQAGVADAGRAFTLAGLVEAAKGRGVDGVAAQAQAVTAAALMGAGVADAAKAFQLAVPVAAAKLNGMAADVAAGLGVIGAKLVGDAITAPVAFALAAEVDAAVKAGMPVDTAVSQAKTAAALLGDSIDAHAAFALADKVKKLTDRAEAPVAPQTAMTRVKEGFALAGRVAAGTLDAAGAKAALHEDGRGAFIEGLRLKAAALPPFEKCTKAADQKAWLDLGACCGTAGFVPTGNLGKFPLELRASMLLALSSAAGAKFDDVPHRLESKPLFEQIIQLNRAFSIQELVPPSEAEKTRNFNAAVKTSPLIQAAKAGWAEMVPLKRQEVMDAVVALHAKAFGYEGSAPAVIRRGMGSADDLGVFNHNNNTMTVNTGNADYGNFSAVFNTVVHESTHRHQRQLIAGLANPGRDLAPDTVQQARVMLGNSKAPVALEVLVDGLGMDERESGKAYKKAPNELHAFHHGDAAGDMMRTWTP